MAVHQIFTTLMLLGFHRATAVTSSGRQCVPAAPNTSPTCVAASNSVSQSLTCGDNLIQNPDFQQSTGTGYAFSTDGWTLCSKSPYSSTGSASGPPNDVGGYSLELATSQSLDTIVSFSQTFPTENGATHDLTLYYKVSNTAGSTITCAFNNADNTKVVVAGNQLSTDWAQIHASMLASADTTLLSCQLEATSTTKADFDQVQVSFPCSASSARPT